MMTKKNLTPWTTSHIVVSSPVLSNRYEPEDAVVALRDLDAHPGAVLSVVYLDHDGNERYGQTYENPVGPVAA